MNNIFPTRPTVGSPLSPRSSVLLPRCASRTDRFRHSTAWSREYSLAAFRYPHAAHTTRCSAWRRKNKLITIDPRVVKALVVGWLTLSKSRRGALIYRSGMSYGRLRRARPSREHRHRRADGTFPLSSPLADFSCCINAKSTRKSTRRSLSPTVSGNAEEFTTVK